MTSIGPHQIYFFRLYPQTSAQLVTWGHVTLRAYGRRYLGIAASGVSGCCSCSGALYCVRILVSCCCLNWCSLSIPGSASLNLTYPWGLMR